MDFSKKNARWVLLTYLVACFLVHFSLAEPPKQPDNKQITIGILSQPTSVTMKLQYYHPSENWTYVTGSYVDWIGSTGALPIFIPFDIDRERLEFILSNLDGVLLPGGGADLKRPDNKALPTNYQLTVQFVIEWAKKRNDEGKYYPIFGTCLGFENFVIAFAGQTSALEEDLDDENTAHSVQTNVNFDKSHFWGMVGLDRAKKVFQTDSVYYTHSLGIRLTSWQKNKLLMDNFEVLATSNTKVGITFVALVEHKKYPFVANQWHAEKTLFERGQLYSFLDRSDEAAELMRNVALAFIRGIRTKGNPRTLKEIPESIKEFFASHRVAEALPLNSYERIYSFQRYNYFD